MPAARPPRQTNRWFAVGPSPPNALHVLQHPLHPLGIEAAQLESKGIAVEIDAEKYPKSSINLVC